MLMGKEEIEEFIELIANNKVVFNEEKCKFIQSSWR